MYFNLLHINEPVTGQSLYRECVRNLDLRVQVHPGELWVSKQRVVHIVLEASKSAGAKCDVPKICGFRAPAAPSLTHSLLYCILFKLNSSEGKYYGICNPSK